MFTVRAATCHCITFATPTGLIHSWNRPTETSTWHCATFPAPNGINSWNRTTTGIQRDVERRPPVGCVVSRRHPVRPAVRPSAIRGERFAGVSIFFPSKKKNTIPGMP